MWGVSHIQKGNTSPIDSIGQYCDEKMSDMDGPQVPPPPPPTTTTTTRWDSLWDVQG